jgi:hypothetical protein
MADLLLPEPLDKNGLNPKAKIPFGVTTDHIRASMQDFIEFLSLIDTQLHAKRMGRLENMLMQANFSSIVSEMMTASIPKHCKTVVKNRFHNGHPDILPANKYPDDPMAVRVKVGGADQPLIPDIKGVTSHVFAAIRASALKDPFERRVETSQALDYLRLADDSRHTGHGCCQPGIPDLDLRLVYRKPLLPSTQRICQQRRRSNGLTGDGGRKINGRAASKASSNPRRCQTSSC